MSVDNADLIDEREWRQAAVHRLDARICRHLARLDEINQTLNPAQYEPQNADYPRHGET